MTLRKNRQEEPRLLNLRRLGSSRFVPARHPAAFQQAPDYASNWGATSCRVIRHSLMVLDIAVEIAQGMSKNRCKVKGREKRKAGTPLKSHIERFSGGHRGHVWSSPCFLANNSLAALVSFWHEMSTPTPSDCQPPLIRHRALLMFSLNIVKSWSRGSAEQIWDDFFFKFWSGELSEIAREFLSEFSHLLLKGEINKSCRVFLSLFGQLDIKYLSNSGVCFPILITWRNYSGETFSKSGPFTTWVAHVWWALGALHQCHEELPWHQAHTVDPIIGLLTHIMFFSSTYHEVHHQPKMFAIQKWLWQIWIR